MPSPWPAAFWRLFAWFAFGTGLGWALDAALAGFCAAALGALLWHLHQLYRFERWLRDGSRRSLPLAEGLWGEVYYHLQRSRHRRRASTRELVTVLRKFQEAAEAVPDAAVVLDEHDAVLWCNTAAERLLGLRRPQDIGSRITHLVRHPAFIQFLAREDYRGGVCDFPAPTPEGPPLSARVSPYGQGRRLLIAADVTRLHRLEQMRRDFVANVSHELRTPLTVIGGYLEALLDSDDACATRWRQPLERMQQQSARMLHIIEDLLLLAKLETQSERPQQRPVAVPGMLTAIAEDGIVLSGERGHAITVEADRELWLLASEQELRSAFSNLIFNAVHHTPAGCRVVLRWYADARGAHLEVADAGDGIAPHHIPRLTERFYRVDRGRNRESGGTGLGLAIVKHVMNRHGGQLRIESRIGVGSTFACDFPANLITGRGGHRFAAGEGA